MMKRAQVRHENAAAASAFIFVRHRCVFIIICDASTSLPLVLLMVHNELIELTLLQVVPSVTIHLVDYLSSV